MSAGREFQVDGAATEKARRASSLCMRGATSIGALEERRARGGAWVCTSSLRYFGVAVVLTLLVRLLTLRPSQRIWARADVWRVLALAVQHLMFFSNFWDQVVAALFSNSVMWSVYQWRNQRGAVAAAPPPSREPELHCILLLHNFTVHRTCNCNWNLTTHTHSTTTTTVLKQRLDLFDL